MKEFLERIGKLEPKRLALLAAQLQSRLDAVERARTEPIAIVGMACRFPGGADTPEDFWRLLRDGADAVRVITADRWDVDALFDADPDAPGRMSTRWAGLLDRVDLFDAPFFGISPREAAGMDPQQRLLLELAWEALERAGIAADGLMGSRTGVFVGISGSDYSQLQLRSGLGGMDAYSASGSAHSVAAGRLSFVLGLQGPCFPIDTACSSSLVAVHQAVQSLRAGECTMALAGGVNLVLSPETSIALSKSRMMAPDGRCKAFDAAADGFVRGEGGGLLVLKRLRDAEADRDPIVALIRGSAINQDGRSNGLTAPNGPSQEAVIRAALASGGVEPAQVGYVEAHGTGTSLGDPIEVQAIAAALGDGRGAPIPIGSVKANIGHLESAAGIAGLIKLALCLRHRAIPPQIHVRSLNPHIPWSELPIVVPSGGMPWDVAEGERRIGGVSSFGFSGTNAHVVLGEAPAAAPRPSAPDRAIHLLTLSARSDAALQQAASRLEHHLAHRDDALADVCFTLNAGRNHFQHRLALPVRSADDARAALRSVAAGEHASGVRRGQTSPARRPKVAFLFTGQGSQYVGMGRQLWQTEPVFRSALQRCADLLEPLLPRPLLSVLFPAPGDEAEAERLLDRTEFTQPALFALEWSLSELWQSWGVRPHAVLGHSVGEYTAACVAGVFSLEQGLTLIAERARLMGALPEGGAMAAVFADAEVVEEAISDDARHLAIAAINGPQSVVLSGSEAALRSALERLAARGVQGKPLRVSHAFHSPLMEPMLADFERAAGRVDYAAPTLRLVSNVSGGLAAAEQVAAPGYWVRHVRAPVRFADGVQALRAQGCTVFLEVGPGATLLGMARAAEGAGAEGNGSASHSPALWLPSLRRGAEDHAQVLDSLAALHVAGVTVDWEGFHADRDHRRVVLPTYPFERERHWSAPAVEWAASPTVAAPPNPRAADDAPKGVDVSDLLFEVAWLPAERPGSAAGAERSGFPAPRQITEGLSRTLSDLSAEHGMPLYDRLLPELDALAATSIVHALRLLGCPLETGERFSAADLEIRLAIVARHRRLFARLLEILAEDGILDRATQGRGEWRVLRTPPAEDPAPGWDRLREAFPMFETEVELVARCATRLADVLRGEADPLQLLFPGGSLADAERLYQETPVARTYNALVRDAVQASIAALPRRRLRILEVGGGTGGTTSAVLPALPADRTEYVFSDVSPRFTTQARTKFERFPFVRYQVLDISRDPAAQGFAGDAFDVVIAANVVHATPDLRQTLANIRSLLAPGGLLVLYEALRPQRFSDLTVGLTEGWWSFTDTGLRPDYALLGPGRWRDLLGELGFAGAATLPDEHATGVLAQQGLVLATAPVLDLAHGPSAPGTRRLESAPWLILADGSPMGGELAQGLRGRGEDAVVVTVGAGFRDAGDRGFEIDSSSADDWDRVLASSASGWRGVVNTVGLDATLDDTASAAELMRLQQRVVGGALHLVQALARTPGGPPPLWLVTRGAQPAGGAGDDGDAGFVQASLWGLSHTVALEHPELHCRRIDLDPAGEIELSLDELVPELVAPDATEDQVALRGGRRVARRLVASAAPGGDAPPARFRADATYLVTGGLRGLGLRVAEWMVERGAQNLVLLGRGEPSAAAQTVLERLQASGARILAARGDVADAERLRDVFADAERTMPPLRGVIHSAGALDDGVLLHQTWGRFETVMAAKVAGSWNLHLLTRDRDLDFFVLFSSGVGLLGAAGQGNHAAANAFVDALAYRRRAQGLPALTINWGAWAEIGAAADHGLAARGTRTFSPEQGLRAMEIGMARAAARGANGTAPLTQIAVLAVDWPGVFASLPPGAEPPIFRELRRTAPVALARGTASAAPEPQLLERLAAARPNRRAAVLQEHLRSLAAQVLGVGDARRIDVHQPLQELGLDSLMAVELRNRIAADVDRSLPATLLFEHPSVGGLSAALLEDLSGAAETATAAPEADTSPTPATDPADPGADALHLSDDDVAMLLLKKLESIEAGQ